jgi:hypothetical protein
MMADIATIERLESRLAQLVDGMLAQKSDRMEFLIGLNRLDDILIDHRAGRPITETLTKFMHDYHHWRTQNILKPAQRKRLGGFLADLHQALPETADADGAKIAEEVKDWLHDIGGGGFRLTLKRPKEQASLSDRFRLMFKRESDELEMLLSQYDHLLTCLDDVLKSAEAKSDPMYRHLAASIIYFLKIEGYKVDPYVRRLRHINAETK